MSGLYESSPSWCHCFTVGPEKVTLDAPAKVNPGDTVELKCSSTGSNPPADITWTINNKPYTERSKHTQPSSDGRFSK